MAQVYPPDTTQPEPAIINWDYPAPRKGWMGGWDTFVGPGMTRAENVLVLGAAALVGVAVLVYSRVANLGWDALQTLVALLIAFDLAGGVVANAASPCKRWYFRAGQGFREHLQFIAIHVWHPAAIVLLFRPGDWGYVLITYGYLMAATVVILRAPLYLQRPLAFALLMGSFFISAYLVTPIPGFEWFLPVFYTKLLVAHVLREEPYRPNPQT